MKENSLSEDIKPKKDHPEVPLYTFSLTSVVGYAFLLDWLILFFFSNCHYMKNVNLRNWLYYALYVALEKKCILLGTSIFVF